MKAVLISMMILAFSATTPLFANPDENTEDCARMAEIDNVPEKELASYMNNCISELENNNTNNDDLQNQESEELNSEMGDNVEEVEGEETPEEK